MVHVPVLQKEVLKYLDPKPNQNFIDCTLGQGGHTLGILKRIAPKGKVLGIERDVEIPKIQTKNLIVVNENFANLKEIVEQYKFKPVHGILFDLGMSSWHLSRSGRGFSFKRKEPLDMRYDPSQPLTARKIVNHWSKFQIEKILKEYGEEKKARKIAEKIIQARIRKPITNTKHLRQIINKAGAAPRRTFQALRIAVNDELNNLKKVLPQTLEVLEPKGKIAVISFHSLEDRIVKNFFKNQAKEGLLKILTKKPIGARIEEIEKNPRSRSAKLRVCQKF